MGETPKTDEFDGEEEFSLEDSVNIDVGNLIKELESEGDGASSKQRADSARKRLERMLEEKRAAEDLMDFDDYELD